MSRNEDSFAEMAKELLFRLTATLVGILIAAVLLIIIVYTYAQVWVWDLPR